jgi:hypothetical protein
MPYDPPALTRDGTDGRVYGGDPNLIHVPDGRRREAGELAALAIDLIIRRISDRIPWPQRGFKLLCPGCYMIVLFNAAVALARANGQPLSELGATMSAAFARLAQDQSAAGLEEIEVILDPCG